MAERAEDLLAFVADELAHARDGLEGPLVEGLHAALRGRMLRLLDRALMVELHAAGMLGLLDGETSEARFASFTTLLGTPDYREDVHASYPLLRPAIDTLCSQWRDGAHEVLARLDADRELLVDTFGVGAPVELHAADSDPHRGGRHVCIVSFEGGARLVYKPRPMAVDVELARLVDELGLDLRVPRTVDRGAWGWAEYVSRSSCTSPEEVEHFHERLGAWLAVLYATASTDVHLENLVAAGAHPVPIDLETTLHPRVFEQRANGVDEVAQELLDEGIHGVGILPTPEWDGSGRAMVDFSALGAGLEHGVGTTVVDAGTDRMRMGEGELAPLVGRNLATLGDEPVDSRAHVMSIERGYEAAVATIVAAKDDLLAPGGALARFADIPVRLLIRPTRMYGSMLDQLAHPHALSDPDTREEVLGQLDRYVQPGDWRESFVASERAQLERWDVPLYEAGAGSSDVHAASGDVLEGVVVRTGFDVARQRIEALATDVRDRDLQRWVVRTSLATRRYGEPVEDGAIRGDDLLGIARAAGDRLERLAIREGDRVAWHTMQFAAAPDADDDAYRAAVIGQDLYGGLLGVVLFLTALARETGEPRYQDLAVAAWRTYVAREDRPPGIGAFSGAAGEVYVRAYLGLDQPPGLVQSIVDQVEHDTILDVVSGAAGAVPALLAAGELDAATACGEHLRAADLSQLPMLRGFSHGPTGVAYALARLSLATHDERYASRARRIVFSESALIDHSTWSDNDVRGMEPQHAWCHGAPGISLGRLAVAQREDDDEMYWDLVCEAIDRVAASSMQNNAGLCHGELGNLEPILLGERAVPGRWRSILDRRVDALLEQARTTGLRTSMPRGLDHPGLMTGIAGIGLGALRLHAPRRMPSVLTLSLPERV